MEEIEEVELVDLDEVEEVETIQVEELVEIAELWNMKNLEHPPRVKIKAPLKQIDFTLLVNTIKEGIEYFQNQKQFTFEAALLSRCVYRMKQKFYKSKDFKAIAKLHRVLLAYLEIDIISILKNFKSALPQVEYIPNHSLLPSRNMLHFVLLKLLGFGKLLCRILETCLIVSLLVQQRLYLGHFWQLALIIFAITSRIYIISKEMVKFTCKLYGNLLSLSQKFQNGGDNWLTKDFNFPECLTEWLDINWLESDNEIIEIPDDNIVAFLNLVEDSDDDIELCDEYVLIKDDDNNYEDNHINNNVKNLRGFNTENIDQGIFLKNKKENLLKIINTKISERLNNTNQIVETIDLNTPTCSNNNRKRIFDDSIVEFVDLSVIPNKKKKKNKRKNK